MKYWMITYINYEGYFCTAVTDTPLPEICRFWGTPLIMCNEISKKDYSGCLKQMEEHSEIRHLVDGPTLLLGKGRSILTNP